MIRSPLHSLQVAGQSVWSDQISREMLDSGELKRRMADDAVTGVTSNPTIFAKAITTGDDYDPQIGELARAGASPREVVATLIADDLRRACDLLRPVWERTEGRDGYVSVEVDPDLAHDTEASVEEAREWVKRIDRPNLLVKIPATAEGIPAIRQLIGEGISVNVTLIFSLTRYREVMEAYLAGLERFKASGGNLERVASVASFFVSRVDTEVDRRIDRSDDDRVKELRGTAAVANARVAYDEFLTTFRGPRWEALAASGARVQRPLWASTSTKDPAYSDIKYVESLVVPHTVNTMPLETIDAYQEHGPERPTVFGPEETALARRTLRRLAEVGIDYDDVVQVLEAEGVAKFSESWHTLLDQVTAKVESLPH
jgi:transaldolase